MPTGRPGGVQLDLLAPSGHDRQRPDRGRVVESIAHRREPIDASTFDRWAGPHPPRTASHPWRPSA